MFLSLKLMPLTDACSLRRSARTDSSLESRERNEKPYSHCKANQTSHCNNSIGITLRRILSQFPDKHPTISCFFKIRKEPQLQAESNPACPLVYWRQRSLRLKLHACAEKARCSWATLLKQIFGFCGVVGDGYSWGAEKVQPTTTTHHPPPRGASLKSVVLAFHSMELPLPIEWSSECSI